MINQEKLTVDIQKYLIINGRVILFDVDLVQSTIILDKDEIISSGGLACIWKKGNKKQIICCNDGHSLFVVSNAQMDQQLISEHLGFISDSIQ